MRRPVTDTTCRTDRSASITPLSLMVPVLLALSVNACSDHLHSATASDAEHGQTVDSSTSAHATTFESSSITGSTTPDTGNIGPSADTTATDSAGTDATSSDTGNTGSEHTATSDTDSSNGEGASGGETTGADDDGGKAEAGTHALYGVLNPPSHQFDKRFTTKIYAIRVDANGSLSDQRLVAKVAEGSGTYFDLDKSESGRLARIWQHEPGKNSGPHSQDVILDMQPFPPARFPLRAALPPSLTFLEIAHWRFAATEDLAIFGALYRDSDGRERVGTFVLPFEDGRPQVAELVYEVPVPASALAQAPFVDALSPDNRWATVHVVTEVDEESTQRLMLVDVTGEFAPLQLLEHHSKKDSSGQTQLAQIQVQFNRHSQSGLVEFTDTARNHLRILHLELSTQTGATSRIAFSQQINDGLRCTILTGTPDELYTCPPQEGQLELTKVPLGASVPITRTTGGGRYWLEVRDLDTRWKIAAEERGSQPLSFHLVDAQAEGPLNPVGIGLLTTGFPVSGISWFNDYPQLFIFEQVTEDQLPRRHALWSTENDRLPNFEPVPVFTVRDPANEEIRIMASDAVGQHFSFDVSHQEVGDGSVVNWTELYHVDHTSTNKPIVTRVTRTSNDNKHRHSFVGAHFSTLFWRVVSEDNSIAALAAIDRGELVMQHRFEEDLSTWLLHHEVTGHF